LNSKSLPPGKWWEVGRMNPFLIGGVRGAEVIKAAAHRERVQFRGG